MKNKLTLWKHFYYFLLIRMVQIHNLKEAQHKIKIQSFKAKDGQRNVLKHLRENRP